MDNLLIVIPAIKKNAVIPDQLVKKLAGKTLIQRAIDTSKKLTKSVLIITDSQEISLIAQRNKIKTFYDATLKVDSNNIRKDLKNIILNNSSSNQVILLYRANTPLVDSDILYDAYKKFIKEKSILLSAKTRKKNIFTTNNSQFPTFISSRIIEELRSFQIFSKQLLESEKPKYSIYEIPKEKAVEIESYQDWWICEKLLKRKRIIFNVIGSKEVGMGHIYRSLTLAHEITSHEIIFMCNKKYSLAVEKIASKDYKVITFGQEKEILNLNPDLVINDALNTSDTYIKLLKKNGIKVINFEDLGKGAYYTDFTINELYDKPILKGENFLWGSDYFFLRDEFEDATPHVFDENISEILITFGGTDQNNLTLITLKSILPLLKNNDIKVNIVCGSGYLFRNELENYIDSISSFVDITLTYETETISQIMERSQVAICSNGRTVYELADMNIPSIVVSHHHREDGHSFATLERGFINLGVINGETGKKIYSAAKKLLEDKDYRYLLFLNVAKYNFRTNKKKIIEIINNLI